MVEYDIEDFKKKYPALYREMKGGVSRVFSFSARRGRIDPWRGYMPGPIDFLRRARTIEEAEEVIDFLERNNEISREEAGKLRDMLRKHGLKAFGPRKEDGYYFKVAGYK